MQFSQRPAYPMSSQSGRVANRYANRAAIGIRHLVRQKVTSDRKESDRICERLTSLTGYDWETVECSFVM